MNKMLGRLAAQAGDRKSPTRPRLRSKYRMRLALGEDRVVNSPSFFRNLLAVYVILQKLDHGTAISRPEDPDRRYL